MLIEPLTDGSPAAVARLKKLAGRHQQHGSVEREVREIISAVERRGDRAVSNFTKRFDGAVLAPGAYEVAREDRDAALESLPTPTRRALESARKRIERFHRKQLVKSYELREAGIVTGMRVTALRRVGVYVPGGRAAYPSSVL
ncbi:MAG: histidinol dehydrogenase, partial [Candidatus Binatia bacterium]